MVGVWSSGFRVCCTFLTFFPAADYLHRHVKKPTGFRASGTAPSYSYASRKQRTSVHMDKIMAKKAEEDKAKAKQKARELKAFGGGGRKVLLPDQGPLWPWRRLRRSGSR